MMSGLKWSPPTHAGSGVVVGCGTIVLGIVLKLEVWLVGVRISVVSPWQKCGEGVEDPLHKFANGDSL
jgi:hypothetical protein